MASTHADLDSDLRRPPPSFKSFIAGQPRWALILRGISGILFGLVAFLMPGITFLMLIAMFAAYLMLDGVLAIVAGWKAGRQGKRWWPFILEGIANIAVAILALAWPGATALALVYLVAIWSIFTGVMLILPNPEQTMRSKILLGLAGLASVLLGIAMITQPVAGSLAVVWLTGAYGLVFGSLLLGAGIRGAGTTKAQALS